MGALTIAFDTTIVGALALPWVALVIHLFFYKGENSVVALLRWVRKQNQPAVAGVLLFAVTYSLGSAVSRIGQDFFNDDDLHLQFHSDPPVMIRVGVTENRILANVYCQNEMLLHVSGSPTGPSKAADDDETDPLTNEIRYFRSHLSPIDSACKNTLSWVVRQRTTKDALAIEEEKDDWLYGVAANIFGLQENALMEKGADYTVRLRQLHQQVMVLRGASFNGVLGFSLCLFAWGGRVRCQKPRSALRWALAAVPGIYLALTALALLHHIFERGMSEPPFMEYTLFLLGMAGGWLVWWRPPHKTEHAGVHDHPVPGNSSEADPGPADQAQDQPPQGDPPQASSPQGGSSACHSAEANEADARKRRRKKYCWQKEPWGRYALLSLILTGAAIFGWWSTEVYYAEQVIYSYNSQAPDTTKK